MTDMILSLLIISKMSSWNTCVERTSQKQWNLSKCFELFLSNDTNNN